MKLYQTPKGTWAGTAKDWLAAMKEEGSDPKAAVRKEVEVPTKKAELLEFLTFHNVNVVNPSPPRAAPEAAGGHPPSTPPAADASTTVTNLNDLFHAAPLKLRLELAVTAIDAADARIDELTKVGG